MRKFSALLLALALGVLTFTSAPGRAESRPDSGGKFRRVERAVPGQYIVVLNEGVARSRVAAIAIDLARGHGGELLFTYEYALKGFAIRLPESAAVALSKNPLVDFVEEDAAGNITGSQSTPPRGTTTFWGIDRINQRDLPLNQTYHWYRTGAGVHVYVLDSGIWPTHEEFQGRASVAHDVFGGDGIDRYNHGTFVAGVIGGATYGVAKDAILHSVKVARDDGQNFGSEIAAGLEWVLRHHTKPAVVNMSLRVAANTYLDNAVRNVIAAGVTCVAAAGNENQPAANYSPARVSEALTVAASLNNDERASYSNYGSVIDLFAPGGRTPDQFIPAPASGYFYGGRNDASDAFTGTSAAAPHVAGVAALYLEANPLASPATVHQAIVSNATVGKIINPGLGSPNRLLYSLFIPAANRDTRADFDGDRRTDISIFRRDTTGEWLSRNSSNGQDVSFTPPFGQSGDIATPGDYNGDGLTDRAVFRPGNATWYITTDASGAFYSVQFGQTTDIPAARDYDGDGRTDLALFRPGSGAWYIQNSNDGSVSVVSFGTTADRPVPGYYDADNKADIAVFRPSNSTWYIRRPDGSYYGGPFGDTSDWPVQADYDADGLTDMAIFRPGNGQWWILNSSTNTVQVFSWGVSGDRPVPGDYDGDGKADVAVQRPDANGTWYILKSTTGAYDIVNFFSEYPVPGGYLAPVY